MQKFKNKTLVEMVWGMLLCVVIYSLQDSVCVHLECCSRTGMEINISCHGSSIPQFTGNHLYRAWQEASHFVYLLREKRERGVCVEHFIVKEGQPDCWRQV